MPREREGNEGREEGIRGGKCIEEGVREGRDEAQEKQRETE